MKKFWCALQEDDRIMIHDIPHEPCFFPSSTVFLQKNEQRGNYSEASLDEKFICTVRFWSQYHRKLKIFVILRYAQKAIVFDGHLRECSNGTVREHLTKVRENQFNACVNMHLIETQLTKTLQPCCCALLNPIWEKCFIQSFFSEVHDPADHIPQCISEISKDCC